MGVAVPRGVGLHVAQPEVGGEVHHPHRLGQAGDQVLAALAEHLVHEAVAGAVHQAGHHLLRRAVRQGAEDHVDLQARPLDLLDGDEVGKAQAAQVGEDALHGLAGVAVAGQHDDLDVGMAGQQADQFGAHVPAGAQDGAAQPLVVLTHHRSSSADAADGIAGCGGAREARADGRGRCR
jgi:hypothetical protein